MQSPLAPGWLSGPAIALGLALVLALAAALVALARCRRVQGRAAAAASRLSVLAAERDRLQSDHDRLAAAVAAGRHGIFDLDLRTGALAASAAFAEIVTGGGPVPVDGAAWLDLVHPDDRDRLAAARAAALAPAATGYECEARLLPRDAGRRWLLEQGRVCARDEAGLPLRLAGTVRDITARKRAEQRLVMRGRMATAFLATSGEETPGHLAALLRDLLESSHAWVGMLDTQGRLRLSGGIDGTTTSCLEPADVPAVLRRVQASAGPLVVTDTGDGATSHLSPGSPLLAARLASGEQVLGLVAVAGRPGGFRADDLETIAGVAADLAPLVQARLAAETADAQAAQAQKMQALGVMAGGIAHDFNNILQAILGFSTLARQDAHDPARLAADLDRVQRATVRGRDLVQRILHFSRPADSAATPVDPLPVLEEIALELRTSQPAGIRVETAFEPGCGLVRAAPEHLKEAVLNLAANAAQAMGAAGGTLSLAIASWRVPADDARFPAAWRGRDAVAITVGDTGPGIPADIRARLFDPFFTTRAVGEGSGLGLSVVHGLVSGLGGQVVLECPPSGGTRATVYLPRVDDRGHGPAGAGAAGLDGDASRRPRVLFVDDDPEIRDLAVALLGREGLSVETAAEGLGACARIAADRARFDVVVTDQYMPGLTGRELALRVAAIRPGLPVILVTGLDEPAEPTVEGALVFREVVTKPFFGQSLVQAVRRALGGEREPDGTSPTR